MKEFVLSEVKTETAVLVGLITKDQDEAKTKEYLDELEFLADTAGAVTVKRFTQRVNGPSSVTYVGSGKLEEIKQYIKDEEEAERPVGMAIFDDELTAKQIRNIEKELGVKILDRTSLILDIFAMRAQTAAAKTQVELAQYRYMLPRLQRLWTHLERQGGGSGSGGGKGSVGLRGPGETQLEMDRRIILQRITLLKQRLAEIDRQKTTQRKNRGRMIRVALVGYTNVGKSTIMNLMAKSEVFAENKLFATLDTTVRKVVIENLPFLLADTVGFIRKLPHHLVEAFKSTLEEAKYADYIIHVVDASNPQAEVQMHIVYETLRELGATGKKTITLLNKQDRVPELQIRDLRADYVIKCSARTGEGLDELKDILGKILAEGQVYLEELYDYREAGKIQIIREYGTLLSEEYKENGIYVQARIPAEIFRKVMPE